MAKLYKRPDSPYWWVDFTRNGRRLRQKTKLPIGNSRGKTPAADSPAAKWLVKFENNLAFSDLGISTLHDISIEELVGKYVDYYQQQFEAGAIKENTWIKVRERKPLWIKRCLANGITGAKALTPQLALQYRNTRKTNDNPNGRPVSQLTWNRECCDLGQIWTFASDKLEINVKNHWADVYYPKAQSVNKKRCLTEEEVQTLLTAGKQLSLEWQFITHIMYYTGARIHAAAELQRNSVFMDERKIWLSNKNEKQHNAYMPDALHQFLTRYPDGDNMWLGEPWSGSTRTDYWTQKWPKEAAKLGVHCTNHDIRNTYITRMTEKLEQRVSMNIVGHSSAKIHELYNHNMAWKYADQIERVLSVTCVQDKPGDLTVLPSAS